MSPASQTWFRSLQPFLERVYSAAPSHYEMYLHGSPSPYPDCHCGVFCRVWEDQSVFTVFFPVEWKLFPPGEAGSEF